MFYKYKKPPFVKFIWALITLQLVIAIIIIPLYNAYYRMEDSERKDRIGISYN